MQQAAISLASGWTSVENRALLGVWGEADVQSQLDGVSRNRVIFEKIATSLREMGHRTWEQCCTKIKNNYGGEVQEGT